MIPDHGIYHQAGVDVEMLGITLCFVLILPPKGHDHHHHHHHHLHVHHLLFRRREPQGLHGRQKVLELGLWKSFEFSHLRAFVYREQ